MSQQPEDRLISDLERKISKLEKQNIKLTDQVRELEQSVTAERAWRLEFVRLMEAAVQKELK